MKGFKESRGLVVKQGFPKQILESSNRFWETHEMIPSSIKSDDSATMKNKSIFGLSKNVWSLGWVSLFNDISSEMIYPLLPLFLTQVLGAGVIFVGLIEGIAESVSSFLKLFSGWFSDRFQRRKRIILFGYSLASVTRPFMGLATSAYHVLFLRFFDRIGKGVRGAPRDALLSHSCGEDERGKAFGFQRAMDHAGAMAGPLIATLLLSTLTLDLRTVFILSIVPAFFCVFILFRGVTDIAGESWLSLRLSWRSF
jgi:MFS family permease